MTDITELTTKANGKNQRQRRTYSARVPQPTISKWNDKYFLFVLSISPPRHAVQHTFDEGPPHKCHRNVPLAIRTEFQEAASFSASGQIAAMCTPLAIYNFRAQSPTKTKANHKKAFGIWYQNWTLEHKAMQCNRNRSKKNSTTSLCTVHSIHGQQQSKCLRARAHKHFRVICYFVHPHRGYAIFHFENCSR